MDSEKAKSPLPVPNKRTNLKGPQSLLSKAVKGYFLLPKGQCAAHIKPEPNQKDVSRLIFINPLIDSIDSFLCTSTAPPGDSEEGNRAGRGSSVTWTDVEPGVRSRSSTIPSLWR